MKKIIFFGLVLFFVGLRMNAQQYPIPSVDENTNKDILAKDWNENEANVLRKHKIGQDTIVFDFDYKKHLSDFVMGGRSRSGSKERVVDMPTFKPGGNYPSANYAIDTTAQYSLRIYKY